MKDIKKFEEFSVNEHDDYSPDQHTDAWKGEPNSHDRFSVEESYSVIYDGNKFILNVDATEQRKITSIRRFDAGFDDPMEDEGLMAYIQENILNSET